MAAVLVGTAGDMKIYYLIDSKNPEKDGLIEMLDGTTREVPFFSYISKTNDVKPLMTSPFHEFLWDEPSEKEKGRWIETFIEKIEEIDKNMLEGVAIQESIGKARKKKTKTEMKVKSFLSNNGVINSRGLGFSTKMIVSEIKSSSKEHGR